jgi:hypothetical protein
MSLIGQREYDCVEERDRALALTEFSGNMGHGDVVFSGSYEAKWQPVYPGSVVGQILWNWACFKK